MSKSRKAHLLLLLTAFLWGTSFVAQSAGMEHIGPFTFNALRYGVGVLVLLPFILARKPRLDWRFFRISLLIGLILFVSSSLQQNALLTASAGKAGFITSLYIVLVPVISLLFGRKVKLHHWLSVAASFIGLYLMTYAASGGFVLADWLLLIGSIGYSFHIISVSRYAGDVDPLALSATQFLIASLFSLVTALFFEPALDPGLIRLALPSILYAGVFSCGVAYTLQIVALKDSHSTVASLIMGLEAVFAVLGGVVVLGERFSSREIFGSLIMLASVFFVQYFESRASETP
ncbi:MAG TPA: DMT family transporter [Bacillota bacterium]|nr:DMT family transporter [Fastidiosipila sp.]HPX92698.1 DMT family transporter [Bacillota bacterium]HQB80595.1 DMT family transporter [Bacillota bacterium]